jgi:hypothetical protein
MSARTLRKGYTQSADHADQRAIGAPQGACGQNTLANGGCRRRVAAAAAAGESAVVARPPAACIHTHAPGGGVLAAA